MSFGQSSTEKPDLVLFLFVAGRSYEVHKSCDYLFGCTARTAHQVSSEKRSNLKGKNLFPRGAHTFLLE